MDFNLRVVFSPRLFKVVFIVRIEKKISNLNNIRGKRGKGY